MNHLYIAFVVAALVFTGTPSAEASHRTSEFDEDDFEEWRRESSRTRDAIDDLDNDEVDDLPIPVLFGVSLSDLYPNFGDPRGGGTRSHEGFDIIAAEGTPIVSPTEAVVIRIGSGESSGKYVTTANPGGETFVYMHLEEIADIDEGDTLDVGDLIGYVGDTGNAAGGAAHLHWEIREDREPKDPYERITREFDIDDKISFLEEILDGADDEDELAEFLVNEYVAELIYARTEGIDLPEVIEDALEDAGVPTKGAVSARDLTIGSSGSDVVALQSVLIAEGFMEGTPTGYFGPITESALAAYQRTHGISPATGYYGPLTRSAMGGSSSTSNVDAEIAQLLAEVARLTALLAELLAAEGN